MSKPSHRAEVLRELATKLGLPFSGFELLDEALTHASCLAETPNFTPRSYEALEFLGDAVLELAVSQYLFENLPGRTPGDYTRLRATVVNRDCVARVARRLGIASAIRLGKSEETVGGRRRVALLADCLEAIIGAAYLSLGWPAALDFVYRVFSPELASVQGLEPVWDYKSILQNYCQARWRSLPRFVVVRSQGPDHRKEFEVEVYLCDVPAGCGTGRSKKEAEQQAAHQALARENVL